MLRSTLHLIGHVLTVDAVGLVEKIVAAIQKKPALIAGVPFPFRRFRAFHPPPPPPLFAKTKRTS